MSIFILPPSFPHPKYQHKACGLKGSVEESTIFQGIWTVSERGSDGLANEYGPRMQIYKPSHRYRCFIMNTNNWISQGMRWHSYELMLGRWRAESIARQILIGKLSKYLLQKEAFSSNILILQDLFAVLIYSGLFFVWQYYLCLHCSKN